MRSRVHSPQDAVPTLVMLCPLSPFPGGFGKHNPTPIGWEVAFFGTGVLRGRDQHPEDAGSAPGADLQLGQRQLRLFREIRVSVWQK